MNLRNYSASLGLALSIAFAGSTAAAGPYEHYQSFNGGPHYDAQKQLNSHRDYRRLYDDHRKDSHRSYRARVIDVQPLWGKDKRHERRYECRRGNDRDYRVDTGDRDRARIVGALAGAAVGGLIGREHDNTALGAVAGALAGVAGGDILIRQGSSHQGRECIEPHKLKYHQQPVAYLVRYRYRDRIYTTRTREHPGRYVRIN